MTATLPFTNSQGVHIRSEKYPLKEGDIFTLFSSQVPGTYRGCPHMAIPAEYYIAEVGGVNGGQLLLRRTDGKGDPFTCSTHSVYAILTDEWSNYQPSDTVKEATIEVGADTDAYRFVANGRVSKLYANQNDCVKALQFVYGKGVTINNSIGDF